MFNAIKGNDKIFMFRSPNDNTASEPVAPWWPGKAYVDIVGMDYYPNADSGLPTFASAYGSFYDTYASANELPFAIGETGTQLSTGGSASTAQKEAWLKAVINPSAGFGSYGEYSSAALGSNMDLPRTVLTTMLYMTNLPRRLRKRFRILKMDPSLLEAN
jgi:hypothetical protein